jgi:hypothetical protein
MITERATAMDAVIYLKNGKRKYGLLIEKDEIREFFRFISNEKLFSGNYSDHIECFSAEMIEAIDINLK